MSITTGEGWYLFSTDTDKYWNELKIASNAFGSSGLTSVSLYASTITRLNDAGASPQIPQYGDDDTIASFYGSGPVTIKLL